MDREKVKLQDLIPSLSEHAYYDGDSKLFVDPAPRAKPLMPEEIDRINRSKTLDSAFDGYLASDKSTNRSSTLMNYRSMWDNNIRMMADVDSQQAPLGSKVVSDLEESDLRELDSILKREHRAERLVRDQDGTQKKVVRTCKAVSPKYFCDIVDCLRLAVKYAKSRPTEYGVVKYDPADYRPSRIPAPTTLTEAPTHADFDRAVKAAERLGLEEMIPLMSLIRFGCRPNEALALRFSDWIESQGAFHMRNTIQKEEGGPVLRPYGKSQNAINPNQILVIPKTLQPHILKFKGASEWVVPNKERNGWMSKSAYDRGWRKIAKEIGLEGGVYQFKHSFITDMIVAGRSIDYICAATRHTNRSMIERVYARLKKDALANDYDQLFGEKSKNVEDSG